MKQFVPTAEDYIKAIQSPIDNLKRLKRFRPYYHPNGALEFWCDDKRIVFKMIDSIQNDYEIGLECPLSLKYLKSLRTHVEKNSNENFIKLYEDELHVSHKGDISFNASIFVHRHYFVESTPHSICDLSINPDCNSEFNLSKDGKILFAWNYGKGSFCQIRDVVIVPQGVEVIADGAFAGSTNLETIIFPCTLKKIGNWAFADCQNLHTLFKCEMIDRIGEYAFYGCNLLPVRGNPCLPAKIKNLNANSFSGCTVVHKGVIIKKNGFFWEPKLITSPLDNKKDYIDDSLHFNELKENSIEDEYGVVYDSNFKYILSCKNKELKKYAVKDTTEGIFRNAFYNAERLEEIDLKNISQIGESAFYGCYKLNSINHRGQIQSIGSDAFARTGLTHVVIPPSLRKLGSSVFMECEQLESVEIKCSITELPPCSFRGCKKLHSVILNRSILLLGYMSFAYCSSLLRIDLPCDLKKIDALCFYRSGLKDIILPESLVLLGNSPFCGCNNLEIVSKSSFFYANELYLLGNDNRILISYLKDESNIVLPASVETIRESSLALIKAHSIILPNSVKYIDHWAFRGTTVDIVNIPKSVAVIKSGFDKEANIKKLYVSKDHIKNKILTPSFKSIVEEY